MNGKTYVVTLLEEPNMGNPEVTLHGAYADEKTAIKAMAEWIVERANRDDYFKESLMSDQNHEDFPKEWDDEKIVEFIVGDYGGAYYVFDDSSNIYNFDVVETEVFA